MLYAVQFLNIITVSFLFKTHVWVSILLFFDETGPHLHLRFIQHLYLEEFSRCCELSPGGMPHFFLSWSMLTTNCMNFPVALSSKYSITSKKSGCTRGEDMAFENALINFHESILLSLFRTVCLTVYLRLFLVTWVLF